MSRQSIQLKHAHEAAESSPQQYERGKTLVGTAEAEGKPKIVLFLLVLVFTPSSQLVSSVGDQQIAR